MERGVYFDGWFPSQHNYHPSLPARRQRMVEHLREYRATSLVWAALGGGSISLPYMEEEAFGQVDPRYRMYGFMNDSEFIAECDKAGIKVFGIVFEVQGWEFPVELNDDESEVLSMNELRGVGKREWMGLREFSSNRYPKLWKPFEHYFPGGLTNSLGEPVTDILEECCSRDIHGVPCHCLWVEAPDREHYCYTMDRNNPVWREYLKAIIRVQIDAGVHGVQLDEAELPITSMQYGGCFCRDCMTLFRTYLQGLDPRPASSRASIWSPSTTASGCSRRATTSSRAASSRRSSRTTSSASARRSRSTSASSATTCTSTGAARGARCSCRATSSTCSSTTTRSSPRPTC